MKKKTVALIAAFVQLVAFPMAHAAKLVIVTDEAKAIKAQEVAALFRTTAPFSRMKDLNLKVIQTTTKKLGCGVAPASNLDIVGTKGEMFEQTSMQNDQRLEESEARERRSSTNKLLEPPSCSGQPPPARLISCDTVQATLYLNGLKKYEKATYVIVVKDDPRYGGSGGEMPLMTSASPAEMAIHELMHQLGFADEYSYLDACEADSYCPAGGSDSISKSGYGFRPPSSFNVAVFNAKASYSSSDDVRKTNGKAIHWLNSIDRSTPLVTGNQIGTPQPGLTGVYRASVCDKASDLTQTWKSGTQPTIMQTLHTSYIPEAYWKTIAKSLGTHLK